MKQISSLLILFGLLFTAQAESIKVMCYNIYGARNTDGARDLNRIIEVINAKKPDIIGLQEVDRKTSRIQGRDIPQEMSEATGMAHVFRKAISFGGGEYGLAILSKFPISDVEAVKLPGSGEARIALLATVETKSGKKLRVLNTHLDYGADQDKQVKEIEELIKDQKVHIAMGDFNIRHTDDKIKGVYKLLNEAFENSKYLGTIPVTVGAKRKKIDYIFFNSKTLKLGSAQVAPDFIKTTDWQKKMELASDHLALYASFNLK